MTATSWHPNQHTKLVPKPAKVRHTFAQEQATPWSARPGFIEAPFNGTKGNDGFLQRSWVLMWGPAWLFKSDYWNYWTLIHWYICTYIYILILILHNTTTSTFANCWVPYILNGKNETCTNPKGEKYMRTGLDHRKKNANMTWQPSYNWITVCKNLTFSRGFSGSWGSSHPPTFQECTAPESNRHTATPGGNFPQPFSALETDVSHVVEVRCDVRIFDGRENTAHLQHLKLRAYGTKQGLISCFSLFSTSQLGFKLCVAVAKGEKTTAIHAQRTIGQQKDCASTLTEG